MIRHKNGHVFVAIFEGYGSPQTNIGELKYSRFFNFDGQLIQWGLTTFGALILNSQISFYFKRYVDLIFEAMLDIKL